MGCLASERLAADPYISRTAVSLSFFVRMHAGRFHRQRNEFQGGPPKQTDNTQRRRPDFPQAREKDRRTHSTRHPRTGHATRRPKSTRQTRTYGEIFLLFPYRRVSFSIRETIRPRARTSRIRRPVFYSLSLSLSLSIMNPARFSTQKITERRTGQPAATIVTSTAGRRIR
jgi:hypothetical protein